MSTQNILRAAYKYAAKESDDPNTQNGAVLITATGSWVYGANHIPQGVRKLPERLARPKKYSYIEHAERAAIYLAGKTVWTERSTLYVPWFACADCARAIILSGVIKVVGHKQVMDRTPDRWRASIEEANEMLDEAGIIREYYDGPIFTSSDNFKILFDGEYWTP